jgi:hypothetical protein
MRGKAWPVIILFLSLVSAAAAQTEFSGDIVDLRKPGTPVLAKLAFHTTSGGWIFSKRATKD